MAPLRVLIRATPAAVANFRELLGDDGVVAVADPAAADVVLVDLTAGRDPVPWLGDVPTLVLVAADAPESLVAEARAGGASVVSDGVSREQLRLALRATGAGLVVGEPHVASRPAPLGAGPAGLREGAALTEREREILRLLGEGLGNRAMARALGLSDHTVKFHLHSIFHKLGVRSRTEAVSVAVRRGLLLL